MRSLPQHIFRQLEYALTIKQPWAWAIAAGEKDIENRSWEPPVRVRGRYIAIHAGQKVEKDMVEELRRDRKLEVPDAPARGAIIAVARIGRVLTRSRSYWFLGPYGWVLEDVRPVDPVPCSGQLGLWRLPPRVLRRLDPALRSVRGRLR